MRNLVLLIYFVSGVTALVFETIWFRLAGIAFGNSIWATTLVLSAFMGGMCLGNLMIGKSGYRIRKPFLLFAITEAVIAASGYLLIVFFPFSKSFMISLFRPVLENHAVLNSLRFTTAFVVMLAPSAAMGMGLPLLVRLFFQDGCHFGQSLGRLYGMNTLGAVVGSLISEAYLIKWLGVKGAALSASTVTACIALLVFALSRSVDNRRVPFTQDYKRRTHGMPASAKRLLFTSLLTGALLLSLEVIWFRFLLLFYHPYPVFFSMFMAVLLIGIGIGSLIASRLLPRIAGTWALPSVIFINGALVALLYPGFGLLLDSLKQQYLLALMFMIFPVSLLSGFIFAFLGNELFGLITFDIEASGMLSFSNSLGAMLGPLAAGFLLIPGAGVEKSFFILSILYGLAAVLTFGPPERTLRKIRLPVLLAFSVFAVSLALFPFGQMEHTFLAEPVKRNFKPGADVYRVAYREGAAETTQLIRLDVFGEPLSYHLLTNGHSMSATDNISRRYMKLFVYLPVALNPNMRNALLIGYGTGSTAAALVGTPSLQSIHIVETSGDIVSMNSHVYREPGSNPLNDPRVELYIEDGRFYLMTSGVHYDLITAEPPPPKGMGIHNLYTEEFFRLAYDSLNEGGYITYWLPVKQMNEAESKSVLRAFCNVFGDCSLWTGAGLNLMMVGSRNAPEKASEEGFTRQWAIPPVSAELKALGLERPEQFATLLIADSRDLRDLTASSLPLMDDHPMRLFTDFSPFMKLPARYSRLQYKLWEDMIHTPYKFQDSVLIKRHWPDGVALRSRVFQKPQILINMLLNHERPVSELEGLHDILSGSSLRYPVMRLLGSNDDIIAVIPKATTEGNNSKSMLYHSFVSALGARDYKNAEMYLSLYLASTPDENSIQDYYYAVYLSFLSGEHEKTEGVIQEIHDRFGCNALLQEIDFWRWARVKFGFGFTHVAKCLKRR